MMANRLRRLQELFRHRGVVLLTIFIELSLGLPGHALATTPETVDAHFFNAKIQPLFNARCVSCHACMESPCQLNLQTYTGTLRGAHRLNAYDGSRLAAVPPTRLFEDASTTDEWRKLGFFDIAAGGDKSLLWRFVAMNEKRGVHPREPVRENLTCVRTEKEMVLLEKYKPEYGMPYGLPSLTSSEQADLRKWLRAGMPGTFEKLELAGLSAEELKLVREWEEYLNAPDLKGRVLARYLYEHFFIAHFALPKRHDKFLRLMRSRTSCDKGIDPVRTRKPNDDPGLKTWSYCFAVDPAATVLKKHIPYEMSADKLHWLMQNFRQEKWSAKGFPSFDPKISRNPFATFRDIPIAARSRFLLEDARYHIMTFIKGPVCNGSVAVNSIQEQFYVLFMDPSADLLVQDAEFAKKSEGLMLLPGNFDAENSIGKIFDDYLTLTTLRNEFRFLKTAAIKKWHPKGLALGDIWDGDGTNPNALLTVFRHDDNSDVQFGARGDTSKTVFLLDYAIFERLVYNLVVNFDVSGDVKHQALTRLYMDLIRMEAENNYLEFLPPKERLPLKRSWYQGALTQLKLNILNEEQFPDIPSKIVLPKGEAHRELLSKIIFERLKPTVRGPDDLINWKKLKTVAEPPALSTEAALREIVSQKVKDGGVWSRLFPEFSLLALRKDGQIRSVYSIIRHREKYNISWMFAESFRLDPDGDSLSILKGAAGAYPNQIFLVEEAEVGVFTNKVKKLSRDRDFKGLVKDYALSRRDPQFWFFFDAIQDQLRLENPGESGLLDLSRYDMDIR